MDDKISKVKEGLTAEINRVEDKEDKKHAELIETIKEGDAVVSAKVDKLEQFALAEVGGSRIIEVEVEIYSLIG